MNEKLNDALNEICDKHIAEAARPKRRRGLLYSAIAAVLVVVILIVAVSDPMTTPANAACIAEAAYPEERDSSIRLEDSPGRTEFFANGIQELLSGSGDENVVFSPLNLYFALALLAESSSGETRQEILDVLGCENPETLRRQANQLWNSFYKDDNQGKILLANSLWLDSKFDFNQRTINTLAADYYASVFSGDLGSDAADQLLQEWLNEQTGGLLSEQAKNVKFPDRTVAALASTVCFAADWVDQFSEDNNLEDVFHSPTGDKTVTYLCSTEDRYYWGEKYGAVRRTTESGCVMWLILPDEGYAPEDLLEDGEALDMVLSYSWEKNAALDVHLRLPEFDVHCETDLISNLMDLGIQQAFSPRDADFTALSPSARTSRLYIGEMQQAARLRVDEEGVEGAAYTYSFIVSGSAPRGDVEEIDLFLDRPFLFFVIGDSQPLFAGVVNQP